MRTVHSAEYKAFLSVLVAARKALGLKQAEVAARLGVRQNQVSRMETGERMVNAVELAAFSRLYRKPLGYFVKGHRSRR